MKRRILYILLIVQVNLTLAQAQADLPAQGRATNLTDQLSSYSGINSTKPMTYGIPLPAGKVINDFYFDTKWNQSSFTLYGVEKNVVGHFVKYDVRNERIEVRTVEGVRTVETAKIKSLAWVDSITRKPFYFVNVNEFKKGEVKFDGLIEVLNEGKIALLKRTNLIVEKPDYNVALGVGSLDEKLKRQVSYYIARDQKLYKVNGKESLLEMFKPKEKSIEDFIKTQKIKTKREDDLLKVVDFANSLNFE